MKGLDYLQSVEDLWRRGALDADTAAELEARFAEEWRALEDDIHNPEVRRFLLSTPFLFRSRTRIVALIEAGVAKKETWETLFERFYAEEDDLQVELYLHRVLWSCSSHDEYIRALKARIDQSDTTDAFPEVRWVHKADYALDPLPESGFKTLRRLRLVPWAVKRIVLKKDTLSNVLPLFRVTGRVTSARSQQPEQCLVDLAKDVNAIRYRLLTLVISGLEDARRLQALGKELTQWPGAMPWTYPGKTERIALRKSVRARRYKSSPALQSYLLRLIDAWDRYSY